VAFGQVNGEIGKVVRNIINKGDSHCKIMESSILNSVHSDSTVFWFFPFL
jgi:hypothetical protein